MLKTKALPVRCSLDQRRNMKHNHAEIKPRFSKAAWHHFRGGFN
jgi:hypothetical protein